MLGLVIVFKGAIVSKVVDMAVYVSLRVSWNHTRVISSQRCLVACSVFTISVENIFDRLRVVIVRDGRRGVRYEMNSSKNPYPAMNGDSD